MSTNVVDYMLVSQFPRVYRDKLEPLYMSYTFGNFSWIRQPLPWVSQESIRRFQTWLDLHYSYTCAINKRQSATLLSDIFWSHVRVFVCYLIRLFSTDKTGKTKPEINLFLCGWVFIQPNVLLDIYQLNRNNTQW